MRGKIQLDLRKTVVEDGFSSLAAKRSLTDLSQVPQDHSHGVPSHSAADPNRISLLNPDEGLSESPWKSTADHTMMSGDVLERYLLGEQEREMHRIEKEHDARTRLLSLQEDDQSGNVNARNTDALEEQINANEMASLLVDTSQPVTGENIVLTTNTALAWTRTTSTNPLITQSVTSCNTTSVQSTDGPYIASLSEILIQRQVKLEEDSYNLLHFIMTNRLTNISETVAQHDDLKKFYLT